MTPPGPILDADFQEDYRGRIESRLVDRYRLRWTKVPIVASDAAAGAVAWQNPTGKDVLIVDTVLVLTTKSTAASTVDVGVAATAVSANNLMTALDTGTAAGVFDNVDNKGASGGRFIRCAAGQFVTMSRASGALAGAVGYLLIARLEDSEA